MKIRENLRDTQERIEKEHNRMDYEGKQDNARGGTVYLVIMSLSPLPLLFVVSSLFFTEGKSLTAWLFFALVIFIFIFTLFLYIRKKRRTSSYETFVNRRGNTSTLLLAKEVNANATQVEKELQKMIDADIFEGYIDHQKHLLVMTRYGEPFEPVRNSGTKICPGCGTEVDKDAEFCTSCGWHFEMLSIKKEENIIENKINFVDQIRDLSNNIDDNAIKNELYSLEALVMRVYERVEERPEYLEQVEKFNKFYIIRLVSLLQKYKKVKDDEINTVEIEELDKEVVSSVSHIKQALETLLKKLYGEEVLDISTDIQVLETMLAKEGLFVEENKR